MNRTGWQRLAAFGGLVAALLLTMPAVVSAHAVLVEAFPAKHDELEEPPTHIRLLFNEPVTADFNPVAVYNYRGERVDKGNGRVSHGNARLVVADLPELPDGLYSVTYRVTSADGHLVTDTYAFTIGEPLGAVVTDEPPAVPQVPAAVGLTHGLTQAAALALAGLTSFFVLVWRPLARTAGSLAGDAAVTVRALGWLALLLAASGLAELAIYAVRASGESLSIGLLGHALMYARAGRFFWMRSLLGGLAAVLATVAARTDGAANRHTSRRIAPASGHVLWWAAVAAGLVMLVALSRQSHAAATARQLPVLADWLHMAGISPWVGGLLGFVRLSSGRRRVALPQGAEGSAAPVARVPLALAVPRFTRVAVVSVAVMGLTGTYGALLHVPDGSALVTTGYGRTLLLKLALLVPVLLLGAINMFRRGNGPFRRLVGVELALIVAIVGVTGFLSSMPPAEAEAGLTAGPYTATQSVGDVQVTLHIDPAKYGYNEGVVTLADSAGNPVTDASVGLRLSMPGHDMGPQNPEAVELEPGRYVVEQIVFGMGGPWDVEVAILTARGRELRTTFRLRVPTPL